MHESNLYSVIGDPHLTNSNHEKMSLLCLEVERLGHPTIWLGDMLHTKEVIRGRSLNFWIRYFQSSKLNHWILVGNHDYFNLDCDDDSLLALRLLPNVRVIDSPVWLGSMLMLPYTHDLSKLREWLNTAGPESAVFAHLELVGFDYGNGFICEDGLSEVELPKVKRIISGHFHKFQQKGNLTYLGTPFSHSFGESNQKKYIGIYNTKTNEMGFVETNFPRHVSIEFNCDLLDERSSHWIIDIEDPNYRNHHYRVILKGKQENIERFPKQMYLDGGTEGKLDIKFINRPSDSVSNDANIDETSSNEIQFTSWARDIKNLDEETVKLGLSILEAVK